MSTSINVALVGYGRRLTTVVKHLGNATDRVRFIGVFDTNPDQVVAARDVLMPQGKVYPDVQAAVSDPDADWVMIGTPNCCHAEQAIAALRSGKHVFCEKPLATSLTDSMAIKQAKEESGKQLFVGFTLRFSPLYLKLSQLVEDGAIGRLISMECNETLHFSHGGHVHSHPWRRLTARGGSHLLEKCCHDIDLMLWMVRSLPEKVASFGGRNIFVPRNARLMQDVAPAVDGRAPFTGWSCVGTRCNPFTGDSDVVDNQVAIIEFANQVRATFHTNCMAAIPERRMLLLGDRGALRADVLAGTIESQGIGFDTEINTCQPCVGGQHGGGDAILCEELAASMLEGQPPRASLMQGLASALTCFAINEAMATGRTVDCRSMWDEAGIRDMSWA